MTDMTGVKIIEAARILTNDQDQSVRTWEDSVYLQALNEGILYIYSKYPESRVKSNGTYYSVEFITQTVLGDVLPISELYFIPLTEYLAYRYFDADAGDTRDRNLAAKHWQTFKELLNGTK